MTDQTKPGTIRQTILYTIGCGCVYPMIFLVVFIPLAFFLLADPVKQLVTTPTIPEFSGPTQENFWSLQEKRLDQKNSGEQENADKRDLVLSHSEFNALLSQFQYIPGNGLVIHRIRFGWLNGRGAVYFFCSGFFLRNLTITFYLERASAPELGDILINSRLIVKGSYFNKKFTEIISEILASNENDVLLKLLKGEIPWSFDDQNVNISGNL